MENKQQSDLSVGECLLLISAFLIMGSLGFADSDKTRISKTEIIGLCMAGAGFSILIGIMVYFVYKSIKKGT